MINHPYVEQPEHSSIRELCAYEEIRQIAHGVTLREPCLKSREEHE